MKTLSLRVRRSLQIGLAAALLGWLLSRADAAGVVRLLAAQSAGLIAGLTLLQLLGVWIAAVKWRVLLPRKPLGLLFRLNLAAVFYSLLIPGQLGSEALKAYRLGKGRLDAESVAASVILDKLTGLIALLVLGLVGVSLTDLAIRSPIRVSLASLLFVCLVTLFAMRVPAVVGTVRGALALGRRKFASAERQFTQVSFLVDAWCGYLSKPAPLAGSIAIGMICQGIHMATIMLLSESLGFSLPAYEWCWIFALVSVATLAPITAGGVGVREGVFVGVLAGFGIGAEPALAVSLSLFGLQLIMGALGAAIHFASREVAAPGAGDSG